MYMFYDEKGKVLKWSWRNKTEGIPGAVSIGSESLPGAAVRVEID
jgi:hypothetical protein